MNKLVIHIGEQHLFSHLSLKVAENIRVPQYHRLAPLWIINYAQILVYSVSVTCVSKKSSGWTIEAFWQRQLLRIMYLKYLCLKKISHIAQRVRKMSFLFYFIFF